MKIRLSPTSGHAAAGFFCTADMVIDLLVINTFGRLAAVQSLLDVLKKALPESERMEADALRKIAAEQGWPFGEVVTQDHVVVEKFHFWLPRYTAYSTLSLLYSVLESQLACCAERACADKASDFKPSDIRGRGIERSARYLKRVGVYDVAADPAWPAIRDLQALRNIIVHRLGAKGENEGHRREAEALAKKYPGDLDFPEGFGLAYREASVSMDLCDKWIVTVELFFDRLFDALCLPPRYSRKPDAG